MRWCNELNVERPAAPTTGNHILDATLRRILERTVAQTTATHLLDVTLRRLKAITNGDRRSQAGHDAGLAGGERAVALKRAVR